MLKTSLLHPEILQAVAGAGHGSQILITDGNYPVTTKTDPRAARVFLNLAPGVLSVPDVLRVLAENIPFEEATVMAPEGKEEPAVFAEFKSILGKDVEFVKVGRFQFYDKAISNDDLCLVIGTGEQRTYANILLTIGVVV